DSLCPGKPRGRLPQGRVPKLSTCPPDGRGAVMASATNASRFRSTGTAYARDTWNAVQRHGGSVWQQTRDFLTNQPALVQGLYYLLIGLWPVLAAESFVRATGHKLDFWLAQRMGLLLVVIGATLCLASYRREKSPEVLLIAVGSAVVMAGTGLLFVLGG